MSVKVRQFDIDTADALLRGTPVPGPQRRAVRQALADARAAAHIELLEQVHFAAWGRLPEWSPR